MSMRKYHFIFILLFSITVHAQQDSLVLDFKEFLGYVKKYHPIAKQAQLAIPIGQANLLKARGAFDPKLEVDYQNKKFKGTEYYDRLNTTFKIPTYFGIAIKGNYQQNQGQYLNTDETLPDNGLYSAGIAMSLGQGFWANERMATLKRAKLFREQSKVDQDLLVNQVLYEASIAYFDWLKAYNQSLVFREFRENAYIRFLGVKQRASLGDIAAIDTLEAQIAVQNRMLGLQEAELELQKKTLELSNFLWIENFPVELRQDVLPNMNLGEEVDVALEILGKPLSEFSIENHPKLRSMNYKVEGLVIEKRLKANKLLPKLDVEYNLLTETPELINSLNPDYYKGMVSFSFPLFLRKERGDLKLAKFKLQDAEFERDNAQVEIKNKILAVYRELDAYFEQSELVGEVVDNYTTLLNAEERKFSFGESSLFLINTRESKLIEAQLKQTELQNKYFTAKAKLFKSLAINPDLP